MLGNIQDRVIAEDLGISISLVWAARNELGIPCHAWRRDKPEPVPEAPVFHSRFARSVSPVLLERGRLPRGPYIPGNDD